MSFKVQLVIILFSGLVIPGKGQGTRSPSGRLHRIRVYCVCVCVLRIKHWRYSQTVACCGRWQTQQALSGIRHTVVLIPTELCIMMGDSIIRYGDVYGTGVFPIHQCSTHRQYACSPKSGNLHATLSLYIVLSSLLSS